MLVGMLVGHDQLTLAVQVLHQQLENEGGLFNEIIILKCSFFYLITMFQPLAT
jgi:hypothetical protein